MSQDTTAPETREPPSEPEAKARPEPTAGPSEVGLARTLPRAETDGATEPSAGADGAGRYELRGELGRGGQGVVWRAWDRVLQREVAVKELTGQTSASARQRFLREALITARLEHPNIVPVYEVGQRADGTLFSVQKLVRSDGPGGQTRTLRKAIVDAATLEQRLLLLPQFLAICQGVAYAHAQGVLHRDLKPENVVLGQFGETVILDWGLARAAGDLARPETGESGERYATVAGVAYGTPAYMSPEQANGETVSVDARSDVWSLGAMLFELLTGRPPFLGRGAMDVVEQVKTARVPDPRELEPAAPPDLSAVARRALQRAPDARFPSAEALAGELIAWQAGRAVSVYRYTPLELARLFVSRNRGVALVSLLAVLAVLALSGVAYARYRAARFAAAHALIERARVADRLRDWNLAALYALTARSLDDNPETQWSVRLLGQREVVVPERFGVTAGGAPDGGGGDGVFGLAFSPDGGLLATAGVGGVVRIYRWGDRALQATLTAHADDATGVYWSADGTRLATSGADGRARLWDVATLRPLADLASSTEPMNRVVLSSDGRWAFSGDELGVVTRYELATGRTMQFQVEGKRGPVYGLALDPGGERLAVVSWSGRLEIRGFDGELLQGVPKVAPVLLDVKYSPDGRRLAAAGSDRSVRVYDLEGGTLVLSSLQLLEGHASKVYALAFSRDSTRLASASTDRTVRLWSLVGSRPWSVGIGGIGELEALDFTPGEERVAVGGPTNPVELYPLQERNGVLSEPGMITRYDGLQSAPGLRVGAALSGTGPRLYRQEDGAEAARAQSRPHGLSELVVSRDGRFTAWKCREGKLCVAPLPALSPERVLTYPADGPPQVPDGGQRTGTRSTYALGIARDGAWVAASDQSGGMLLWTLPDGALKHRFEPAPAPGRPSGSRDGHSKAIFSIDGSPDGALIATGAYDHSVRLWSAATGELVGKLEGHHRGVRRVRFSPDGRLLASVGWDRKAILWDVAARRRLATREGHEDHVFGVDWAPDGTWLATGGRDGTIRIWEVPSCHPLATLTTEESTVFGLAVWGNGEGLWYSGAAVRRFPFRPLRSVPRQLAEIERATNRRIDERTLEAVPLP